ncbi:hypothetical protein Egran_05770 [Elaphomyces granulatus]|uniref:6-methylsalicylic acid synthase n=1 Tax=Elaphomyces granulatus TaxID=519963 RepID=A0A232LQQ8_9EURO|nr:hypothetical protein Egran_05770 [Elaphomyces granulatus]
MLSPGSTPSLTRVPTPGVVSEDGDYSSPPTSVENDTPQSHDFSINDIAIIGMACRVPGGVNSPSQLWDFLLQKGDASGDMPSWRWAPYHSRHPRNEELLAKTTSKGYFLDKIEDFDASFFSVSPREAEQMDPQQRIALEVAWEALENAGISPQRLAGSNTSVYMGVNSDDYGKLILEDLQNVGAHMGVGTAYCGIPSRISYLLDLMGPSVALDAACASSLVAVHHARQAIRAGETDLAIAGGVNALLGPGLTRVLDEAGAIAADGKCRSFDDSAHGYGRGEGAGVVVLKRLDKALADGDHVLAVLKGTAVCSDGKTVGIMAPNAIAQQLVARKALQEAKVTADSIHYIEAHATSTSLGDPTETDALAEIYGSGSGRDRSDPCYIGSIKPNIGHLEAGAGVMGLIKAVMVLQQGSVPPQANLQTLNKKIDWKKNLLRPCFEATKFPPSLTPARAGIASYGYSGTVSHAIIEAVSPSYQPPAPISNDSNPTALILLSTPQANRLPAAASALKVWLEENGESVSLTATATTLARHRAHHRFRNAIVAESVSDAIAALGEISKGGNGRYIVNDRVAPESVKGPVWVFSGHGAQWAEMGHELFRSRPSFYDVVQKLEPIIQAELGFSAIETLHSGNLDRSDVVQVMTFLMHLGIAAVLGEEAGPPSAVVGHSLGETAAAVISGALTWHEGALIVCRRARLYREVMGQGAMILVRLSADEARSRIGDRSNISVAIDASPTSCVLSGTINSIQELADAWKQEGIEVRQVASDVPFHTQLLSKLADPLCDALYQDLHPQSPQIPLYSTSQQDPRANISRDIGYWVNNMVQPVRLRSTVAAMVQDGFRVFVEISSHPIVTHSMNETVSQETEERFLTVPTMVRKQPAMKNILTAVGRLHCFGCPVAYIDHNSNAPWVSSVPGTLWNHQQFYKAVAEVPRTQSATHDPSANDLLGARTTVGRTEQVLFQTHLDEDNRPFPGHHPLHGSEIVPAAVLINSFLKATSPNCLEDVSLKVPVVVSPPREIQILLDPRQITITSRLHSSDSATSDDGSWLVNTTAKVGPADAVPSVANIDLAGLRSRLPQKLSLGFSVDYLASVGVPDMGFPWRVVEHVADEQEMLAQVETNPENTPGMNDSWASILDAATSIASTLFHREPKLRMPTSVRRVIAKKGVSSPQVGYINCSKSPFMGEAADILVCADDGTVLVEFQAMAFAGIEGEAFSRKNIKGLVHRIAWPPTKLAEEPLDFHHVAFLLTDPEEDTGARVQRYQKQLHDRGLSTSTHLSPKDLPLSDPKTIIVHIPQSAVSADTVFEAVSKSCEILVAAAKQLISQSMDTKLFTITNGNNNTWSKLGDSPLYGLSRIIQSEHPEIWGGLVEVEDDMFPVMAIKYVQGEDVVKIRDGVPRSGRLRPFPTEASQTRSTRVTFSPGGTYLITGGLGALGLEVAQWMVEQGARRLLLASRRKLAPRSLWNLRNEDNVIQRILALESLGATVHAISVDISVPKGAADLSRAIGELGMPPVTGVVHAAGVLRDQLLEEITTDSFDEVLAPKLQGALNLHTVFPPGNLDFFLLFSSCGQLLGFPGQSSYASGNAFLDALAAQRRLQGDNSVSMLWTSWHGLGMAASTEYINAELTARGITDVTTEEAFMAWENVTSLNTDHAVILRARLLDADEPLPHPILQDIAPRKQRSSDDGQAQQGDKEELRGGMNLEEHLAKVIGSCVASTLSIAESDVDPLIALSEMGMDSVMTVTFRTQLQQALKVKVGPTLIWKCPTVDHLIKHFLQELQK